MVDRKYNILLVHNYYKKPGGEDVVFENEKKLLEDNGHRVFIYTRTNKDLDSFNILKIILLPFIAIFNLKTYFDIKYIIKEKKIDIIHVHNTLTLISPAVFYAAVKMKKPVIQTLHNFRIQCPNGLFYRDGHICEDCINKGLYSALKHKCYRNSFLQTLVIIIMQKIHRFTGIYKRINFICLTDFNKNKLLLINNKNQIINENKVFVKPNFVFSESSVENKISNNTSDHIELTNINNIKRQNEKDYYLFVGRLDEIKGIDIALEAFSRMPDRKLHVVGSGGEEYIKKYSRYSNIKFLGQITHEQVLKKMDIIDKALIFPSIWYEGQPMTIIEAYNSKLPVISSDVGNIKELVKDGITGLHFEAGNVNSLIDAVFRFEKMDIDNMKRNAYEEYSRKYNDKVAYKLLINIYNQSILIDFN